MQRTNTLLIGHGVIPKILLSLKENIRVAFGPHTCAYIVLYIFFIGYIVERKPLTTSPHFEDGTQGKP
jgi:hypothetical protein